MLIIIIIFNKLINYMERKIKKLAKNPITYKIGGEILDASGKGISSLSPLYGPELLVAGTALRAGGQILNSRANDLRKNRMRKQRNI